MHQDQNNKITEQSMQVKKVTHIEVSAVATLHLANDYIHNISNCMCLTKVGQARWASHTPSTPPGQPLLTYILTLLTQLLTYSIALATYLLFHQPQQLQCLHHGATFVLLVMTELRYTHNRFSARQKDR